MKSLKCIGGPWDGRKVVLHDGRRELVARQQDPIKLTASLNFGTTPPKEVSLNYTETVYVIDAVHCDSEGIEYLRPRDWSPMQALIHALGT